MISLVDLGWTPDFKAFFSLQDVFSFFTEDLLPLECLLQKFGYNIYIQKVIATNIYPIALAFIVIISWFMFLVTISSRFMITRYIRTFDIIKVSFFIVIVLLFPEVISKCLSLFTCLSIEDSNSIRVLLYSPEVTCWSEEHISFLLYASVPGLIAWGLLAPLIISLFLWKNRDQIKTVINKGNEKSKVHSKANTFLIVIKQPVDGLKNAKVLKFLYKGYSSKYYYWELVVFLKKFLLISIGCVSDLFPSNLRGVILLIFIIYLLLIQMRCEPFESKNLNRVEFYSLLTTFLTANIGILMFTYDFKTFALPLLIVVILMHAAFLLFWAYLFLNEIMGKKSIFKFIVFLCKIFQRKQTSVVPK